MNINLPEIVARLGGASIPEICRATGLPYNSVKNVRDGGNPTWETLEKIAKYFADQQP